MLLSVYVCVRVCMRMEARGPRWVSSLSCDTFWDRISHWSENLECPISWTSWPGSGYLPLQWIVGVCYCSRLFGGHVRDQLGSWCSQKPALPEVGDHSPPPDAAFWCRLAIWFLHLLCGMCLCMWCGFMRAAHQVHRTGWERMVSLRQPSSSRRGEEVRQCWRIRSKAQASADLAVNQGRSWRHGYFTAKCSTQNVLWVLSPSFLICGHRLDHN